MKTRIAIIAACAGTLVLASADLTLANPAGALEPRSAARITDVAPDAAIKLAQNAAIVTSRSNIKHPGVKKEKPKTGTGKSRISDQAAGGVLSKKKK